MSDVLTVSGAARVLEIPEQTVRSLERRGKLSAVRDSSGRRLFDRREVERFAKERSHEQRERSIERDPTAAREQTPTQYTKSK
jgi:excisionase family DNA binding protein